MTARSLALSAWAVLWGCVPQQDPAPGSVEPDPTIPTDPGDTPTDPGNTDPGNTDPGTTAACSYPDHVEPMTLGEVLQPFRWSTALHRDGRQAALDLGEVPCNDGGEIDWSPFDVLLFVSIPAW